MFHNDVSSFSAVLNQKESQIYMTSAFDQRAVIIDDFQSRYIVNIDVCWFSLFLTKFLQYTTKILSKFCSSNSRNKFGAELDVLIEDSTDAVTEAAAACVTSIFPLSVLLSPRSILFSASIHRSHVLELVIVVGAESG